MTRIDSRIWLALLAPVALLLSGCVASATQDAADPPREAEDVSVAARSAPPASQDPSGGPSPPYLLPVALEGETGVAAFVCVWAVVTSDCEGAVLPVTPIRTWFPQDLDGGALDAVDLTMTWDAATPVGEELLVGLAITRGDRTEWVMESGPSPLRLHRTDLGVSPGAEVAIYAWTDCDGEFVVWTCTTDPQLFRIEGALHVVGAA